MGKSEKLECAVPSVGLRAGGRLPERNQPRLRGMNGQAEARKALRQHGHDPAGIVFPLAADDKVIGKADQKAAPFHPGFDVVLVPFIQDLMQEDIGQHRRDDAALRGALARGTSGCPPPALPPAAISR